MASEFNSFQSFSRTEIGLMKNRMNYIEELLDNVSNSISHSKTLHPIFKENIDRNVENRSVKSKDSSQISKTEFWKHILGFLNAGKINDSYREVFIRDKESLLIKLMGKTGIIIEYLDTKNREYLLIKILEHLNRGEYVEFFLPWMISYIDRRMKLSISLLRGIIDLVQHFLSNEMEKQKLSEFMICELNRIYNVINSSYLINQ